jgi:hypothetical protein
LSIGLVSTNPTACRGGPCAYEGKELFQYQEVMIDDKGLRLDTRQGGQEWHHVLSSARRASLQAQVRPVPGSACIAARAARRTPASSLSSLCLTLHCGTCRSAKTRSPSRQRMSRMMGRICMRPRAGRRAIVAGEAGGNSTV